MSHVLYSTTNFSSVLYGFSMCGGWIVYMLYPVNVPFCGTFLIVEHFAGVSGPVRTSRVSTYLPHLF